MAGRRLEDLDVNNEPLPDIGWSSYLELAALIEETLKLDLDDDPTFARFCEVLRFW